MTGHTVTLATGSEPAATEIGEVSALIEPKAPVTPPLSQPSDQNQARHRQVSLV